MPSIGDIFDQLKAVNTNLQAVQTELTQIDSTLTQRLDILIQSMQTIVSLGSYADNALAHLAKQDDTIICYLGQVSRNCCSMLNELHTQTELQASVEGSTQELLELYRSAHADAAIQFDGLAQLRKELHQCCPPPQPEPACTEAPCPAPPELEEPPQLEGKIL